MKIDAMELKYRQDVIITHTFFRYKSAELGTSNIFLPTKHHSGVFSTFVIRPVKHGK